jgi:hypothetical protein
MGDFLWVGLRVGNTLVRVKHSVALAYGSVIKALQRVNLHLIEFTTT